jgi:hypothetical protein
MIEQISGKSGENAVVDLQSHDAENGADIAQIRRKMSA